MANLETENVPVVDKEEDGGAPRNAGDMPVSTVRKTQVICRLIRLTWVVFGMS